MIATLASVKRVPAENIKLDTNLQEMGIDSLDVFTLLFELENAFKISIPDDDVRSIKTVNDVVVGVEQIPRRRSARYFGGISQPGELAHGITPRRRHRPWDCLPARTRSARNVAWLARRPLRHRTDPISRRLERGTQNSQWRPSPWLRSAKAFSGRQGCAARPLRAILRSRGSRSLPRFGR